MQQYFRLATLIVIAFDHDFFQRTTRTLNIAHIQIGTCQIQFGADMRFVQVDFIIREIKE